MRAKLLFYGITLWFGPIVVAVSGEGTILEPWIETIPEVFSSNDCQIIIDAAEKFGFPDSPDSIDYGDDKSSASWAIDIIDKQEVLIPSMYNLLTPYLDKLRDVVAHHKIKWNNGDTSEPTLDWVFLRRYTAGAERRQLKLHHDVNVS